jgi:hypothetical protein
MEVRLSQQIDIAQNYNGQGDSNSALGARSKRIRAIVSPVTTLDDWPH